MRVIVLDFPCSYALIGAEASPESLLILGVDAVESFERPIAMAPERESTE